MLALCVLKKQKYTWANRTGINKPPKQVGILRKEVPTTIIIIITCESVLYNVDMCRGPSISLKLKNEKEFFFDDKYLFFPHNFLPCK